VTLLCGLEQSAAQSQTMGCHTGQFRWLLKTFLFGQWGHSTVWTVLTAPNRNILTYLQSSNLHGKSTRFYCMTRMHSAYYAVARCFSDRPSVCHTLVLSLNSYIYLQSFFTIGSPTIVVFPCQTEWQYSDGDPLNGSVECKGYEKITIFDQYLALSHKWCKIEP